MVGVCGMCYNARLYDELIAQAIDHTCRPHGGYEWCKSNRLYQHNRMDEASKQMLEEYNGNT